MKLFITILALLTVLSCSVKNNFPKPVDFVSDFEQIYDSIEKKRINRFLNQYEKQTTKEIVVVSLPTIKPYSNIQEYAIDLGNYWGVGKKSDNGLVIVISKTQRSIGIATGKQTEKVLNDSLCKYGVDSLAVPHFKKDNYYKGTMKMLNYLTEKWR